MLINDLPIIMIKCLIITIVIELVLAIILKVREKKDLLNIILVNILTNPLVVAIPVYFNITYGIKIRNIILLLLEILTIFTEGYIYKRALKYKKINPFILAIILNCTSYLIGEIINL